MPKRPPRARDSEVSLDYDGLDCEYGPRKRQIGGRYESEPVKGVTSGPVDVESGQRSAFPVANTNNDGAVSGPPLNVSDYLLAVRAEAQARPSFVASEQNFRSHSDRILRSYDGDYINSSPGSRPEPRPEPRAASSESSEPDLTRPVVISKQWHDQFVKQFTEVHGALADRVKYRSDLGPADGAIELPHTLSKWRQFILTPVNAPTLKILQQLDHMTVVKLLGYCRKWASARMDPNLGKWIYALLIKLPHVVTGEEVSILRQLAKKCLCIRNNPHDELDPVTQYTLDMILCVVGDIYGQSDLIIIK
uniref:ARAD1C09988p n=1 Tax=Blastobotrys adeninivorans TaxID=409370 RepID=A0A060T050_BLAAD